MSVVEPREHQLPVCDAWLGRAFDLLGKRWNGVILGSLRDGSAGFLELRRAVGAITDSVLSSRLVELVEYGLVRRTVTEDRPPRVIYELTDSGRAILPILDELARWAAENLVRPAGPELAGECLDDGLDQTLRRRASSR